MEPPIIKRPDEILSPVRGLDSHLAAVRALDIAKEGRDAVANMAAAYYFVERDMILGGKSGTIDLTWLPSLKQSWKLSRPPL